MPMYGPGQVNLRGKIRSAIPAVFLSAASAPLVLAVGTRKMLPGATVMAMVQPSSGGAQQAVGFSGQFADRASALGLQGSGYLGVGQWTDQSGNANHMTQGTAANMMQMYLGANDDDVAVMTAYATGINVSPQSSPRVLRIPGLPSVNRNNVTIFQVIRQVSTFRGMQSFEFGDLTSNPDLADPGVSGQPMNQLTWDDAGTLRTTGILSQKDTDIAHAGLDVLVERINSTSVKTWCGDRSVNSTGGYNVLTSRTLSLGGQLGTIHTFAPAGGGILCEIVAFLVYNGVLTDAEIATKQAELRAIYNTTVGSPTLNILYHGDSLMEGVPGANPYKRNIPRLTLNRLGTKAAAFNYGQAGQTAAALASFFTGKTGLYIKPGAINVVRMSLGSNDITINNRTAAQVIADIQTGINGAFAAGWDKIILNNIPPRGPNTTAQNAERSSFNSQVNASTHPFTGSSGRTAADITVADYAADPIMGAASAPNDATLYYSGDRVHPTEYGNTFLSAIDETALRALGAAL